MWSFLISCWSTLSRSLTRAASGCLSTPLDANLPLCCWRTRILWLPSTIRRLFREDDTSIEFHANTHLETSPAYIYRCRTRTPGTVFYDLRLDSSFLVDVGEPHNLPFHPPICQPRALPSTPWHPATVSIVPTPMRSPGSLLDEEHAAPTGFARHQTDAKVYTWGRVGEHNIVIASLPAGVYGTTSTATTASGLLASLPSIRVSLLVGTGGGIARPDDDRDIRLGRGRLKIEKVASPDLDT
ncbi:hypothetical protein CEP52_016705 [Fusarium oligoseptatum]|uniref:Nucleoside phosphorylase domain-containing protein n=1 Tax=Fusarium oligoseptatum TaxID=2604345 RepID=A0A428S1A1_9HYPO|nr:hypothetical protein CEP52_016705 [Fusarium oligoseptatum]